jgi:hypothetical protein
MACRSHPVVLSHDFFCRGCATGSHADQVGDAVEVERRCTHMAQRIAEELHRHTSAQRTELSRLRAGAAASGADATRIRMLERNLAKPLRLLPAGKALAVSAQPESMRGIETLRELLINTAFDKSHFPRFGKFRVRDCPLYSGHRIGAQHIAHGVCVQATSSPGPTGWC